MKTNFSKEFLDRVAASINSRQGKTYSASEVADGVHCTPGALNKAVRHLIHGKRLAPSEEERWRGWLGMNGKVTVKMGAVATTVSTNGNRPDGQSSKVPEVVRPSQVRFLREKGTRYSKEEIARALNAFIACDGSPGAAATLLEVPMSQVTNCIYRYWNLIPKSAYDRLTHSYKARRSVRRRHKVPATEAAASIKEDLQALTKMMADHIQHHESAVKKGWLARLFGR